MTGQGSGRAEIEGVGVVIVDLRSVNHRYFDARLRLDPELAPYAGELEDQLRRAVVRGRVEVTARAERATPGVPTLDRAAARAAFEQLCELRDELRPNEPVPLSLLATVPNLFVAAAPIDPDAMRTALRAAARDAAESLRSMRAREGTALAEEMLRHLDALDAGTTAARARVPEVTRQYADKLRARIATLVADATLLDEGRLEHEVALVADRADVAEELARLESHLAQARSEIADGSDGKRLDFLFQEMSREVNTLSQKSSDAELARIAIEMKTAVARLREQVQNVL
ncbi:MAG: YicC/YloC family endoribonuclease [Sandaracinaceae bacterium]